MKRLVVSAMMILAVLTAGAKGKSDWKGKVVDENGEPVAYANVAVLSKADSTVVCGAVTAEDGSFNIVTSETDGIMMVAMMGYKTVYLAPVDGAVVTLPTDTEMLEGAGFEVSRDGKAFVVTGSAIQQLIDSVNFDD